MFTTNEVFEWSKLCSYQPNMSHVCFTLTFVGSNLHPNTSFNQTLRNPPNISSTQYFLHPWFLQPNIRLLIFLLRNHEVRQAEWLQAHRMMPTAKSGGGVGGGWGLGEGGEGGGDVGVGGGGRGEGWGGWGGLLLQWRLGSLLLLFLLHPPLIHQ